VVAILCLIAALATGSAGGYKAVVEHQEVHRLRAIKDIHQKLKDDADRIDEESNTYLGSALAQSVAGTAQSLIDSTQEMIDQHYQQEEIGYGLLMACMVFLVISFAIFWRRAKARKVTTEDSMSEAESAHIDSLVSPTPEKIESENGAMPSGRKELIVIGCIFALVIFVIIIASISSGTHPTPSDVHVATQTSATSVPSSPTMDSDWQVDTETNPVTGIQKKVATLKYRDKQNIIIRLNGETLDCYITTDEFLETVDNMDSRVSTVQYKFDDGKVIRQGWTISGDNTALFYPGNCSPFIAQLRKAKSLAFEYRPSEKIPATITFDVAGFPDDFKTEESMPKRRSHGRTE